MNIQYHNNTRIVGNTVFVDLSLGLEEILPAIMDVLNVERVAEIPAGILEKALYSAPLYKSFSKVELPDEIDLTGVEEKGKKLALLRSLYEKLDRAEPEFVDHDEKGIDKIGVEIESVSENKCSYDVDKFQMTTDGSIKTNAELEKEDKVDIDISVDDGKLEGTVKETEDEIENDDELPIEWVSDEIDIEDIDELKENIRKLYQNAILYVNESMGLHFHVSFKNVAEYEALESKEFEEFFIQKLKESNIDIEERLNNKYCSEWNDGDIEKAKKGERETKCRHRAINLYAEADHGTIEFRIFPAMDSAEDVIRALDVLLDIIREYKE